MSTNDCFVTEIDVKLADKMRGDLMDQGFELTAPPHIIFSAKKQGVSCTLYTSGKLTVQGKNKADFLTYYLEPEILKTLAFSYPETLVDMTPRIGIDEAGKGDFFGPLCIAGVYANEENLKKLLTMGVKDSKRLSDESVITFAIQIKALLPYSIVRLYPEKYNELYGKFGNLNQLLAWGHATAIAELVEKTECRTVTIDQFGAESLVENALKRKKLDVSLTQRHYGESDPVVAAASILARAAFLDGLEKLGENLSIKLPKGASAQVITAAKAIVSKHGSDILKTLVKLHFKTLDQVLND